MSTFVASDWSITRSTGDIRYIGTDHGNASASYTTVIDFHRALQAFADDQTSSGDDELDITDLTPSDRSTDNIVTLLNGFNIDDTASEHIFDGSIIQDNGDTIYDGIVNFGTEGVTIQIIQDGAVLSDDWWNSVPNGETLGGLNRNSAAGISHRFMLPVRRDGADIDQRRLVGTSRTYGNTYSEFSINGSTRGNNVLALSESSDLNNATAQATVATYSSDITFTEGYDNTQDIDDNGTPEEYFLVIDYATGSRTINDVYEFAKNITRDGTSDTLFGVNGELFRGVTTNFAYDTETNGSPVEGDRWVWGTAVTYDADVGLFTVGEVVAENGGAWAARVLANDITNNVLILQVDNGTISDNDSFTGSSSSATADVNGAVTAVSGGGELLMLGVDDDGTSGNIYAQITKGGAPTDNTRIYDETFSTQFLDVNGSVTSRSPSTPWIGVSTGSALIGAYGVGMVPADAGASDIFTDLLDATINPPNNVTFSVSGLVASEDQVLVGPEDGAGGLDLDQLSLSTSLTTDNVTSVVVSTTIPTDTPSAGTIRVQDDDGRYRRLEYSSFSGSTFTISSTDGEEDFNSINATSGNNVFISYIDLLAAGTSASFTAVYNTDRTLFVRVRDGKGTPIRTFETTGTLGSAGGSSTAIRTSDE